ncbi:unnamed protein product [Amoebophrya sp. A120]|nr:unnamed protein product [Amoebophrya sp. A120]|eukprot:GSA120T00002480001.1
MRSSHHQKAGGGGMNKYGGSDEDDDSSDSEFRRPGKRRKAFAPPTAGTDGTNYLLRQASGRAHISLQNPNATSSASVAVGQRTRPEGIGEEKILPPRSTTFGQDASWHTSAVDNKKPEAGMKTIHAEDEAERRRLAKHRFLMEQLQYNLADSREEYQRREANKDLSQSEAHAAAASSSTRVLKRPDPKSDLALLREFHQFIPDEDPGGHSSAGGAAVKLAQKYYDRLFKEYVLGDLRNYKRNQFGFRWRTAQEVRQGKGQFVCGSKHCEKCNHLKSYEVNFVYMEQGAQKQALVKIKLCVACAFQLNYVHLKKKRKERKKAEKKARKEKRKKEKKKRKKRGSSSSSEEESDDEEGELQRRSRAEPTAAGPLSDADIDEADLLELERMAAKPIPGARVDKASSSGRAAEDFLDDMFS